jgi:Tfp pilus assembly protein PilF
MRRLVLAAALLATLTTVTAAPDSVTAGDARDERLALYLRTGQYTAARRLIDEILQSNPTDDLKNVRAVFADSPNMRVRSRAARFACEVWDNGVLLPLTVMACM